MSVIRVGSPRGGYLYAAVLITSLIVSAMGLTALAVAALKLRTTTATNEWAVAAALAQAGVEDGIAHLSALPAWRTTLNNDVEGTAYSIGTGIFTWKVVDDDGDLNDDDSDSVRLVGIGRAGDAVVAESVRLLATGTPLSCLEVALYTPGNVTVGSAAMLTTDQRISSAGNVAASAFLASIAGDVEAVGTISGNVSGAQTTLLAARRLPGSSVFDYYKDNGTWLAATALPDVSGVRTIQNVVLSPQGNPYGTMRNPEGIYVVDCGGARVCIKNCRIVGTIVLLNPGANSSIDGSVRWDAAVGNYPALLVQGDLQLKTSSTELSEATLAVNFNPVGVPYSGTEDADQTDAYPAEINGVVYVSGTLNAPQDLIESQLRGVTACNSFLANSSCRFNYRPRLFESPPPGFASGNPMLPSPGSRRRETLSP